MENISREKVRYGLQAYILFLNVLSDSKGLKEQQIDTLKADSIQLLEELSSIEPLEAVDRFNRIIETMNGLLPTPYPHFMADSEENLIKGEITAFEYYLNQELKANHLTVQQEAPLFNASLELWEKVGTTFSTKESILEFNVIIEKLNQLLPEKERYPFPDENQY